VQGGNDEEREGAREGEKRGEVRGGERKTLKAGEMNEREWPGVYV